jgi:hypothetical protein
VTKQGVAVFESSSNQKIWSRNKESLGLDVYDSIVQLTFLDSCTLVLGTAQGKIVQEMFHNTSTLPVIHDFGIKTIHGLCVLNGNLYISAEDGRLLCLVQEERDSLLKLMLDYQEFDLALKVAKEYHWDTDPIRKAHWDYLVSNGALKQSDVVSLKGNEQILI